MIIHLINNYAWLLYHKMIPLCIVYDVIRHRSGPSIPIFTLFSQVSQYSQCSRFSQKSQFSSGPSQPFLLQVFTDTTNFSIFRRFYNIHNFRSFSQKSQLLSGPSQPPLLLVFTDSTNFPIFREFYNFRSWVQTWTYLDKMTPISMFHRVHCSCKLSPLQSSENQSKRHWLSHKPSDFTSLSRWRLRGTKLNKFCKSWGILHR